MTDPDSSSLLHAISTVTTRLTATSAVRDDVLTQGRQAIRHAANCVHALHRGEQARSIIDKMRDQTIEFPQIYQAGYVQDAMKEYAEAAITRAILRDELIPTGPQLGVEDAAWLNALAESGSELRRDVLDTLRGGNLDAATRLLQRMDEIYSALITIDFPDAITGGLRRTTDQFRAVLERTRGDLTVTSQQRRLEDAILRLHDDLKLQAIPES
jgi:translin